MAHNMHGHMSIGIIIIILIILIITHVCIGKK